jgi:hypothetical protein
MRAATPRATARKTPMFQGWTPTSPTEVTAMPRSAARECDEDADAGSELCGMALAECGSNVLRTYSGPNEGFLYYDQATGELIGAAYQVTDESVECVASEIVAGERPPLCCEVPDAD